MSQKTAIQELIEVVEMDYNNGVEISMKVFHSMLTKALEKEKQQLKDAIKHGIWNNETVNLEDYSEIYYNETFKND